MSEQSRLAVKNPTIEGPGQQALEEAACEDLDPLEALLPLRAWVESRA